MRKARVLDWDLENRPLSYLAEDYTTAEITAISWAWMDRPNKVHVRTLTTDPASLSLMLTEFWEQYHEADVLVGHYIRKHDLPVFNGACLEVGLPPLAPKLVVDTKLDMPHSKYMSLSQESLAGMLGLTRPKVHMTQTEWRAANRLTPEGLELTIKRCTGDVKQNIQLYKELKKRGWLGAPRLWCS